MVEEVINNIIEAEEKAEAIVKESQLRAKEIVAKAKEDATILVESEKKKVQLALAQKENEAFSQAGTAANKAIADCEAQAEEMAKKAQKNIDKAVEYIVGSMTQKYGK